MIAVVFALGVVTGLLLIPGALLALFGVERIRHGYWCELDKSEHGSCGVPDDQWSQVYRCHRCGARQARSWLRTLAGEDRLRRWVSRGPRDEAWLNGEVDA